MKVLVTGASGFIGKPLTEYLLEKGHQITVLTRNQSSSGPFPTQKDGLNTVVWNPEDIGQVIPEMDGMDAVINLAGESVAAKRWTAKQKKRMFESRIHTTDILVHSIEAAAQKPKALINASAVGYYGSAESQTLTENSPAGEGFLSHLSSEWEIGRAHV